MIWVFSDPHYAHKNIIRGCSDWTDKSGCRDFDTFTAHNDWVVDTINAKVAPNDVAWCLGDWSFGGEPRIREFRERLNCGDIHLILGNHDNHIRKAMDDPKKYGFSSVRWYAEITPFKGFQVALFHYPIESWNRDAHVHGHTHGKARTLNRRFEVCPEARWIMSMEEIYKEVNGGDGEKYGTTS